MSQHLLAIESTIGDTGAPSTSMHTITIVYSLLAGLCDHPSVISRTDFCNFLWEAQLESGLAPTANFA